MLCTVLAGWQGDGVGGEVVGTAGNMGRRALHAPPARLRHPQRPARCDGIADLRGTGGRSSLCFGRVDAVQVSQAPLLMPVGDDRWWVG